MPDAHAQVLDWLAGLSSTPDAPTIQLVLPPTLTKWQRASLHKMAAHIGLHTCSEVRTFDTRLVPCTRLQHRGWVTLDTLSSINVRACFCCSLVVVSVAPTPSGERRPTKPLLSPYARCVYRWCQADIDRAAQVSQAEVGLMIDGEEPLLPYVEAVIDTRQHLESVFDALHVGNEDEGAGVFSQWLPSIPHI